MLVVVPGLLAVVAVAVAVAVAVVVAVTGTYGQKTMPASKKATYPRLYPRPRAPM